MKLFYASTLEEEKNALLQKNFKGFTAVISFAKNSFQKIFSWSKYEEEICNCTFQIGR